MTLRVDSQRQTIDVTLSTAAAALSDALDLGGYGVSAIVMTTAWTAANLTFQGSADNSTFRNIYGDTGGEVTVVGTAAATIALGATIAEQVGAHRYVKVRSGLSGALVPQTTERALALIIEPR